MKFQALKQFYKKHIMTFTLAVMVIGLVFLFLSPTIFITVPAGHLGVRWFRFFGGTDMSSAVQEGTHFKWPWDELYDYDARTQLVDREYDVITKDGLLVQIHLSILFRVKSEYLGILHKNVGPDYLNTTLIPELGAVARTVVAQYGAEEFYTTHRMEARNEILEEMHKRLYENNSYSPDGVVLIELDKIMLHSIVLPDRIIDAIEAKIEQFQLDQEYEYRVKVAIKEKERKRIEGEGIRELFDKIGEKDLSSYLRLAGINATLELAKSNNAKIIITGSSLNALPLLIGNDTNSPDAKIVDTEKLTNPKK